jgi:single-strand DNA-binding protein
MANEARIHIVGNLGRDSETRYTPNGQMNVTFTVAVNVKRGQAEITNWYRVTAWGRLAEIMDSLVQQGALAKGRQVYAAGSLVADTYQTREGDTRISLDLRADAVQLLGSQDTNGSQCAVSSDSGGYHDYGDPPF